MTTINKIKKIFWPSQFVVNNHLLMLLLTDLHVIHRLMYLILRYNDRKAFFFMSSDVIDIAYSILVKYNILQMRMVTMNCKEIDRGRINCIKNI